MQPNTLDNPVWTAMITPLTSSGQPDLASLEQLLREQDEAGNGILILGSTGEALNLDLSERKLIVEFTESLGLSVPIMAGVGGHHLPDVISWLCYLETRKIDAYLMVAPLYAKPGPVGQYHWFTTLMDFVSRPVMLYNIPGRTGVSLHTDMVHKISNNRNFWAIKEASGSVDEFLKYRAAAGDARVYSGDDIMLPAFSDHGVAGVVSVASNAWPKAVRHYCQKALSGELRDDEIAFWKKAAGSLFSASNPVPVKSLLCSEGRIRTPEVKLPLHRDDMQSSDEICRISREVMEWHAGSDPECKVYEMLQSE